MKDDTISRQAAIDYFVTNIGWHDEDGYPVEDSDELRKIWTELFNGVPSAQPGWISCSERLPGKDDSFYVLCCDKYSEIMIGNVFECYDGETPYSAESENGYMYDCVAWMPLPTSYREGGQ